MRLVPVIVVVFALLPPAAWARGRRAGPPCAKLCAKTRQTCEKQCGPKAKDCLRACAEDAAVCPELCEIGRRNRGDPQAAERAARLLLAREEAAAERAQEARQGKPAREDKEKCCGDGPMKSDPKQSAPKPSRAED